MKFQDGTIGDELVVKPISAAVRSHIHDTSYSEYKSQPFAEDFLYEDQDFVLEKRRTTDTDDYIFLDENEAIEDEDVMMPPNSNSQFARRPRRRHKRDIVSNFHVIFKRKSSQFNHPADYGK